jgi:hypothetical protein
MSFIGEVKMKILLCVVAAMLAAPAAQAEMFDGGYIGATGGYEKNTVDSTKLLVDDGFPNASTDKKASRVPHSALTPAMIGKRLAILSLAPNLL